MQQYSASCPQCSFVLLFYDASLFGRKGRCPKCRHKFVLHEPSAEEPKTLETQSNLSSAAPKPTDSPAGKDAVEAATNPSAGAASTVPAENKPPWEVNMNRGLGIRRPTLPPRWVFPDVLAISTLLVIVIGAAIGTGAASLLLKNCPVSYLTAAAVIGGSIALCFRVRKYDPLR